MYRGRAFFAAAHSKIAVAMLVGMIAVGALPALAVAAPSVSTLYPANGGNVKASPPIVGANIVSTGVALKSATMSISGGTLSGSKPLRPSIQQTGGPSGYWTVTEVTNPKGLVVIKWVWTSTGTTSNCVVSAVPPTLGVGTYTVVASFTDMSGASVSAGTWVFTVGTAATSKPIFATVSPAVNSTVATASPVISVEGTGAVTATATINGVSTPAAVAPDGKITLTPAAPLANGVKQIAVTATNAGGSSSKAWSFTVQCIDPADTRCTPCHAGKDTAPTMGPNCTWCHANRLNPDGTVKNHGFDPVAHTSIDTCLGACHKAQIKDNHDALATPVTCEECHVKRDALGKPWDKTCSACHPTITHSSANHAGTDAAVRVARTTPSGTALGGCSNTAGTSTGCHDITNIAALHRNLPDQGCALCHGAGKAPKRECLDCHKEGAATDTMPLGSSIYHHLNAKYLFNPPEVRVPGQKYFLDSNAQPYFRSRGSDAQGNSWSVDGFDSPRSGWVGLLFDADCAMACHNSGTTTFTSFGGNGIGQEDKYGTFTDTSPVWSSGGYPKSYRNIRWSDGRMTPDYLEASIYRPGFYQYRYLEMADTVKWLKGAPPTVTFLTQYKIGVQPGYSWTPPNARLEISNDNGTTWTTVGGGTVDGATANLSGTSAGYGTPTAWTTSAHTASYDLAAYVTTMPGTPTGNDDPADLTWNWASWVPSYMRTPENVGQSFNTYDPALAVAHLPEYDNLWYWYGNEEGQWYGELWGQPFGSYTAAVAKPFKLRFSVYYPYAPTYWAEDYIWGDLQFKDFKVTDPSHPTLPYWSGETGAWTHTYVTQRASVGVFDMGHWLPALSTDTPASYEWFRHGYGEGYSSSAYVDHSPDTSKMWYSGQGDLGRTSPVRTITLKDAVAINGWSAPTYPYTTRIEDPDFGYYDVPDTSRPVLHGPKVTFQTNYMLQGADALAVEGSPDGGANWYPLTRIASDETPNVSLSGSSSSGSAPTGWTNMTYYFADPNNAPYASGQTVWDPGNTGSASVKIRFRYVNGADSASWGIGLNGVEVANPLSGRTLRDENSSDPSSWVNDGWTRGGDSNSLFWSSLWGNGQEPVNRDLTLNSITIPSDSPKLSFMTYYDLGTDEVQVQISTDGGGSWATLSGTVNGAGGTSVLTEAPFSGNDQYGNPILHGWVPASYDLSAYAGQQVKIRFHYVNTTVGTEADGLAIDNVAVSGTGGGTLFVDDAETLNSNWVTNYWRRVPHLAKEFFNSQN